MFRAVLLEKTDEGQTVRLTELEDDALPVREVLVDVAYSTLNYKDALAITNSAPIAKTYPLVPGVDFSGTVIESTSAAFQPGDKVILNGWGVGELFWGGLASRASVDAGWLISLPEGLSLKEAMMIGTAGYTAMLCLMGLEDHGLCPDDGPVLVTGAAGGVGSFAVSLLARGGFEVVAMTGRSEERAYLEGLGATDILARSDYQEPSRPLLKQRWAGAVDTVGGQILANVAAEMNYQGVISACGMAAGMKVPVTVMPFILRGVKLIGIDSVYCPADQRRKAWARLSEMLDHDQLETMTEMIGLDDVIEAAPKFMAGQVRGRLVVDVNAGGA